MKARMEQIANSCLAGEQIGPEQVDNLLAEADVDPGSLLFWANRIRQRFFGNKIKVCSIVPGQLGGCNQDCKFCAQSARYDTDYRKTQTLSDEEILGAAEQAKSSGVRNFGIVYSGKTVNGNELTRLEGLISEIKNRLGLKVCASLGVITTEQAQRLTHAGLTGYNHNLETSESHFANIVTTHKYVDRVSTINVAKEAGLRVCAGGIFGIGESDNDRVQMALKLRQLNVDIVPMNFLHPIDGTPLGDTKTLEPREILRIIALYRFILPQTTLKIAGGRVLNLRDLQSWIFYAGANAILSGNYLTTSGRSVEEDMQMLADLGMQPDLE
jgi:biotin synthase